jgi:very-short-patch-repair endonuclease
VSADPLFLALVKRATLPAPVAEYRFAPPRRWRLDYAWPDARLALEVEGGVWTRGRHTRGSGFVKDMEKYNELAARGWRLLRVTPDLLATLSTVELLRRALTDEEAA